MLYLRPQRVYKPSAASQYNLDDYLSHLLDQMDESLYRLRLETPRGTSITEDNSQITCYAHIFDKGDGTELTDLLKGRGWRPTWLLDDKPIDSARISEEGYLLTLETTHLPAIYQTVTLQARDTDILLALTDEAQDKAWLQRVIASGDIPTHLLQANEKLLDIHYLDKLRIDGIEIVKQELSKEIAANTTALEELNKHPLTVSQDGYWRIWDALKKTYVTTEYQSRGEKGEPGAKGADGKDAGRYLGRASSIDTTLTHNYMPESSGRWESANEGDYVYMTTDGGSGWHKDTYYIARARTYKTVWEQYDIKGRAPVLTLDSNYRLLADGVRISAVSLKGDKGDKGDKGEAGATGEKGPKGDKPKLTLDNQYRLLADGALVSMESLRGPKGDAGATGEKGPKGDKPKLTLDNQYRLLADGALVSMESLRGPKGDKPVMTLDSNYCLLADGVQVSAVSLKGARGEAGATGQTGPRGEAGHSPEPEEVLATDLFRQQLSGEVSTKVTPVANDLIKAKQELAKSNQYIDTAFEYLQNISNQIISSRSYSISTSGYITFHSGTCAFVEKDTSPGPGYCMPPKEEPPIRVTLRSDFDQLKQHVDILTARLAQLQSATTITPITDTSLRSYGSTLYPKYGDWLMTSDASTQYLSFSGLNAEIGKSIYIQTRRKAYLYANGHSFFGLPGDANKGTAVDQWLSNNTTYRFVRANATAWLVTASSSPYPWT